MREGVALAVKFQRQAITLQAYGGDPRRLSPFAARDQRTNPMNPADQDIESRRPVWRALSDLFLDTELDDRDLSYIARILAESRYTLAECEKILFHEVYPVCIPNMLSVAGEWAGFDYECLEGAILTHARCIWSLSRVFQPFRWMIRGDWNRVKEFYTDISKGNGARPT